MDDTKDQKPAVLDSETIQKILDDAFPYSQGRRIGLNAENAPIPKNNIQKTEPVRWISTASWVAYELVRAVQRNLNNVPQELEKYASLKDEILPSDIEALLALCGTADKVMKTELEFVLRPKPVSLGTARFQSIPSSEMVVPVTMAHKGIQESACEPKRDPKIFKQPSLPHPTRTNNELTKSVFLDPKTVRAIITQTDQVDRKGTVFVSPGSNGEMIAHLPGEVDTWATIPEDGFIATVPRFLAYKLISTWLVEGKGRDVKDYNGMVTQGLIARHQGITKKSAGRPLSQADIQKLTHLFSGGNQSLAEDMQRLFSTQPETSVTLEQMANHRARHYSKITAQTER